MVQLAVPFLGQAVLVVLVGVILSELVEHLSYGFLYHCCVAVGLGNREDQMVHLQHLRHWNG